MKAVSFGYWRMFLGVLRRESCTQAEEWRKFKTAFQSRLVNCLTKSMKISLNIFLWTCNGVGFCVETLWWTNHPTINEDGRHQHIKFTQRRCFSIVNWLLLRQVPLHKVLFTSCCEVSVVVGSGNGNGNWVDQVGNDINWQHF